MAGNVMAGNGIADRPPKPGQADRERLAEHGPLTADSDATGKTAPAAPNQAPADAPDAPTAPAAPVPVDAPAAPVDAPAAPADVPADPGQPSPLGELREDITALITDARTYAAAEVAFQKSRAAAAGKKAGLATAYLIVALVLLHLALIALAVGLLIALAPLVTIWGAIALVVGGLLAGTAALVLRARREGQTLAALFEQGSPS